MPQFILSTKIKAPIEVCFDLARSIELHIDSMAHTGEKAIAGVTSGLIGYGETVTWKARHFGVVMTLTSSITELRFPYVFSDEMLEGPFQMMAHKHRFERKDGYTLMVDEFIYQSPLGILGKIADWLFLKKYMCNLIQHRNNTIKQQAELHQNQHT